MLKVNIEKKKIIPMDLPKCCLTCILTQPVWLNYFGFRGVIVMVDKYHWIEYAW